MKQITALKSMLIMLFCFCSFSVMGQTLEGKVIDENGDPLPYANVIEKGTTNGTVTDNNGNFSINPSQLPAQLEFSLLGFSNVSKEALSSGTTMTITLVEKGVGLNEIVLVGSRNPSRTAIETPVPVDVIDLAELTTQGPQTSINEILNYVAPSFTSQTQTVSDGTDHIDPASLRGL